MLAAPSLFGALFGCTSEATIEPRAIHAHYPRSCDPGSDSSGSRAIELRALGDFDPGNATVVFVAEHDRERVLAIPEQTQAVELRTVGPEPHWGVAAVADDAAIDVALWPAAQPCDLFSLNTTEDSPIEGASLGINGRWLLAIGLGDREGRARGARLIDLGSGNEQELDSNMTRARSFASLTAVEDGLLAAGGEDLEQGTVHDDAELFDVTAQRFQANASVIALRHARTRHAALALDASSVVLIGGADGNGQPIRDLERVTLSGAAATDLAELGAGRIEPTALRLSDGRIVVAGGYAVDASSQAVPIGIVEWFNAQATRQVGTLNLEDAALGRAFIATSWGGLLAAGGCDSDEQPVASVWWIDAEQRATRLPDLPAAAQSCAPLLAAATLGSPLLFSNGALWRFDPWSGEFVASEIALQSESRLAARVINVDAGLLLWMDGANEQTNLWALRHDTRNTFSSDVTPFLLTDESRLAPELPDPNQVRYTENQELELTGTVGVWITDTRYLDFDLELMTVTDDASPPLILIGSNELGGNDCPWPSATDEGVFRLRRRGTQVTLIGSRERTCSLAEDARVPVGFRANGGPVQLRRVSISRGAP
jgi:hypothetical protein